MKYLEDEKLTKLTSELTDAIVGGGDRVINGRIEAYTMKRAGSDKKYAHALGERFVAEMEVQENQRATLLKHPTRKRSQSAGALLDAFTASPPPPPKQQRAVSAFAEIEGGSPTKRARACSFDSTTTPETTSKSALGDFYEMGTRRLMTDLILTLNASFPDYDFGSVRPEHFSKIPLEAAYRRINERLSVLADLKGDSFLGRLWTAMNDVISLGEADVYSFEDTLAEDDTTPLWSFNYFLVNKHRKRIVFFCCVESMQSDDDVVISDAVVTESIGYRGNDSSNFDMDPENVAGGIPIDTA